MLKRLVIFLGIILSLNRVNAQDIFKRSTSTADSILRAIMLNERTDSVRLKSYKYDGYSIEVSDSTIVIREKKRTISVNIYKGNFEKRVALYTVYKRGRPVDFHIKRYRSVIEVWFFSKGLLQKRLVFVPK